MKSLLYDMSSFHIAPTVGRELASQLAGLLVVLVAAVLALSPPWQVVVPAAYVVYALVRVVLAARQQRTVQTEARGDR